MPSMVHHWPPYTGRVESVDWTSKDTWDPSGGNRRFWIGWSGLGFCGSDRGYNAHFYDLRHPWERYSHDDYRWVFFFKQIARGLREFVRG